MSRRLPICQWSTTSSMKRNYVPPRAVERAEIAAHCREWSNVFHVKLPIKGRWWRRPSSGRHM